MENIPEKTPSKLNAEKNLIKNRQFSYGSPHGLFPKISTPPSRLMRIKNPFEPLIKDRLDTHFMR